MIELREVSKIYDSDTVAVDNISFNVNKGEIFGLIGTSGCGKTTTLKMINRLVEPTEGHILVNGQSILKRSPEELRRNIGYVIQSIGLFPHYSIKENISIVPKLLGWDEQRIEHRRRELLEMVGMEPDQFANRKPSALSGGQQQRVGLARALAGDPEVLLMDEPFGALDPITKEKIREEFKKLLHEIDKTVILVTHDVLEAFDLCDRICLMDKGKAMQTGSPKELLFQPENEFVRSFFDNHRLQLEMMSITVGDIIDFTAAMDIRTDAVDKDKAMVVDRNTSLYTILEDVEIGKENSVVSVLDSNKKMIGVLNPNQLLEAFRNLRYKFREGDNG